MSDINMEAAIRLSAEDRASAVIRDLQRDVDALRRSLAALSRIKLPSTTSTTGTSSPASGALNFKAGTQALAAAKLTAATDRQVARQREADAKAQERGQRRMESDALRAIRDRDRATAKTLRDQLAAQRLLERETRQAAAAAERDHDAALRRQANGIRYLASLRARHDRDERRAAAQAERDVARRSRETWNRGRNAINDTFRPAGITALTGTAATVAGTRRVLGAERDVDTAEVNVRAYGGLSFDAARELRERWAAPLAESLGSETAKLLTAWTDATKLGIPAAGASAFAELSTKTAEAWAVPFETVTDVMGTLNTVLTSKGKAFSIDRLKSVSNAIQHLAAKQSTTPERLLEFMKQGAGGAQLLGMSLESAAAFGSASTSLGNRPGESGRLLDYSAGRVIEMPRLAKKKGDEGKQARELVKALGYASAQQMDDQRRADPDSFLPDLMDRFNRINNPKKKDEAIRYFYGREWLGEASRMIVGVDTYREAVKLARESKGLDAIGEVWKLHQLKLGFVFKQFRAGWLNILGQLGMVLSPMARQAGDYFLEWSSKLRAGGLQARFKAVLDGILEGFGFNDLPDALRRIFGKPGQGSAGAIETWRATAREFAAGLRDVFGGIGDLLKSFSGGSPEVIARWTGRILALSAALVVLSPVITTLSGFASGILAMGAAATTALAAFKLAGLAGAGGAAAGAAGAAAGAGGLVAILGAAVLPVSLVAISAGVVAALWGREALKGSFLGIPSGNGGAPRTPESDLGGELGAIAPRRRRESDPPAEVQKQSYGGYNGAFDNRLIHPASLQTGSNALAGLLHRVAIVSSPNASAAVAAAGGGVPGGFFGSSSFGNGGVSRSGSAPTVQSWFGRGNGTQGGGVNSANSTASAAMLDAIAGTESGKAGYDAVLGNGRYGTPSKPVSTMTLDEAFAFGRQVRARHGSSSALGRYQIVGTTMRAAQKALGLGGETPFNAETQDRMARWIARNQGLGAWEGLKHNPRAMAAARAAMAQGGALDAPTGSSVTGSDSEATAGGVHPLDGKGRLTSDFGMRKHPITGAFKMHRGIDLAAPAGTVVKAMKAGIASLDRSGDLTVKADDGSSTTYRHIQAQVEAGARIAAGQAIGRLRAHDPRSTGPHLHLEGRDARGGLIDPKTLLTPRGTAGEMNAPLTTKNLLRKMPAPPKAMPGQGSPSGKGGYDDGMTSASRAGAGATIHVTNHIHGAGENPQGLAAKVQRHIAEAWNYRSHDLEPELT